MENKPEKNDQNLSVSLPTGSGSGNMPMLSPVDGAVRAGSLSARDYLESGWKRDTGERIQSDRGYKGFSTGIKEGEIYPWYTKDTVMETGKLVT